jgi:hypothetical protein
MQALEWKVLPCWLLSVATVLLLTGCSPGKAASDYFYVEIAPTKFVPVRFPYFNSDDLVIKYNGNVVTYKGPPGVNMPESLMEYDGKLYVLAFDASARRYEDRKTRGPWRWRCFEQDGKGFKEIPASTFPRSIAIINIWRPNGFRSHTSRRFSTGTNGEKIDQIDLVRSLDTENLYFANSEIAWLWFMLEVNNDFDAISGGGPTNTVRYNSSDRKFVREFKAKYKPVQLTKVELKPVPRKEQDF